jgi:tRNA (guanine-N7-)-methyltransferase
MDSPIHPALMDWHVHYPHYYPTPEMLDKSASTLLSPAEFERIQNTRVDVSDMSLPLVRFADIGCGYGGLLMALSPLFPTTLMLGIEIRNKVEAYVHKKIDALRTIERNKGNEAGFGNISVLRSNAQKYLPNLFYKGQARHCLIHSLCVVDQDVLFVSGSALQEAKAQGTHHLSYTTDGVRALSGYWWHSVHSD